METFFDEHGRPKINLAVKGKKQTGKIEAVLDTGFDGFLSLPITTAVPLGLELIGVQPVEYADGRRSKELVFSAEANLNDAWISVPTTLTGGTEALVGTSLFKDYEICFNFRKQKISLTK